MSNKVFMLSEEELNRICLYQPYRDGWILGFDPYQHEIDNYYGKLIESLTQNQLFETNYLKYNSGNYLEFICYPKINGNIYIGNAIILCVSLFAPIAAYGQIDIHKEDKFFGWNGLFKPELTRIINDTELFKIEKEIIILISKQKLTLLDPLFVSKLLPEQIYNDIKDENHNFGNQYLHGIFQKFD